MQHIESLKEILPYVRAFQGKTFVIKLGGEVCRKQNLEEIAPQLSLIHHIGIHIVIVHGGGPQMDETCARLGIEKKMVHGRRITDAATLSVAKMVYAGLVSTDIVSALRKEGSAAAGLSGVDAFLVQAKRRAPMSLELSPGEFSNVDFENVGDIVSLDLKIIKHLSESGIIPVIASLGGDEEGNVFNINADTIASKIAQALNAEKLIVLTNVPGVLQNPEDRSSTISYTDLDALQSMIKSGSIHSGMLPKVQSCIDAIRGGVARTHILDGTRSGSLLLELFVNQGCGTMIVSTKERLAYEQQAAQE